MLLQSRRDKARTARRQKTAERVVTDRLNMLQVPLYDTAQIRIQIQDWRMDTIGYSFEVERPVIVKGAREQ